MFNCREVTRMISESLDRSLPLHQRIGIRIHLFMCRFCSLYREQLLALRKAIGNFESAAALPAIVSLPEEAKIRMKSILAQQNSSGPGTFN